MITAIIAYIIGCLVACLMFLHRLLLYERDNVEYKSLGKVALLFGLLSWVAVIIFIIDEIIDFFKNI
jgi:4-hydroxybenzoate polyprenyltransferase